MSRAIWLVVGLVAGAAAGAKWQRATSVTLSEQMRAAIDAANANPGHKIPIEGGYVMTMDVHQPTNKE